MELNWANEHRFRKRPQGGAILAPLFPSSAGLSLDSEISLLCFSSPLLWHIKSMQMAAHPEKHHSGCWMVRSSTVVTGWMGYIMLPCY